MGETEQFRMSLPSEGKVEITGPSDLEKTLRRDIQTAQGNLDRYLARKNTEGYNETNQSKENNMKLFAIEITRKTAPIIALLNNGVEPIVPKKKCYFIFDATWNSDVVPEIVNFRELSEEYDIASGYPIVLPLKRR